MSVVEVAERRASTVRTLRGEGRRPAVDVVVLVVAIALAILPLVPVFGVGAVVAPVAGGLVLGAALAAVAARFRWGAAVTVAATLAVYLLAGTTLATPGEAVLGVLPSGRAMTQLLGGAITVWKQVLTLDPVLGGSGGVLVAPFLLALVGSVAAVSTALRARRRGGAWAAVVPVVVLGVSMLLATKVSVAPLASGVLLALGLLVWVSWRRGTFAPRRVLSLLLLGAVLTASGATVGPWLADQRPRFVLRDELVPPFDPREQASPLSSFRKFVKDWADTDLVTVRGLPAGASVRLATMDAFDGVVWNVAGAEAAQGSGQFRRVGDTIDTSVRGTEATVQLEVHDLPFVWLPTVGYTEQVTFRGADATDLSAALRYNDATGTAVLVDGVPDGTRWTARVVVPTSPDEAQLEAAAVGRVTLPTAQGVPDAVTQFAAELAGTATSPALIARSLEAGLAEQGYFSHGLTDSGQAKSLSGHGADRLTLLLTDAVMVGDGEQYASAMALMAREMGLPARVVLGFRPTDEQEGDDEITFTGNDIQAWVEISFDGYGWVAFWPTPDETRTPQDQTPQDQSEPEPQVRQPPPPPQDPVTPPDDDAEQPSTEETQDQDRSGDQWLVVARIVGVVGGPILVVLGPPLLVAAAKARRRRRRRSAPDGVSQVVGGWDELLDQATDLRRPAPPAATRREVAVQLAGAFTARRRDDESAPTGRRSAPVGGPVAGLAASADAVVFGAGDPTPAQIDAYWAQVDVAVAAMRAVVPRRTRWLSRWSPASLRGWWRRSPARAGRGTSTPDR